MCEHNNRCACSETFHIGLEPLELLVPKLPETTGLKIKDIDQCNEMDAVFVKAVPTGAFRFDSLQVPFTVKLSAIVEHIVLPRNVENILGPAALENLVEGVELFRL